MRMSPVTVALIVVFSRRVSPALRCCESAYDLRSLIAGRELPVISSCLLLNLRGVNVRFP